jgi:Tol biopolymer transport system component
VWPPLSGSGGGWIAFVTTRGGNSDIWIMNADGSDPRPLTTHPAQDGWPRWSRDGKRMVLQSTRDGAFNLYVADLLGGLQVDESTLLQLTSGTSGHDSWEPAWSPDGKQVVCSVQQASGSDLFLLNPDGTVQQQLTKNTAIDGSPDWSPDGKQIVFFSSRDGNWEIYVINADGSEARRLTNHAARDHSPAWSPDGTRIAFVSERDGNEEIYLMNPDGGNLQRLTDNGAGDSFPAWSPDGKRIAFSSSRDGNQEIYVMNADGSSLQRLTDNPADDHTPTWRP